MAQRRLLTVTDTFTITGRGIVLVPGLVPIDDERFRVGDPIVLRRPDGVDIETNIVGLELPSPNPNRVVLILLKELRREDVPVGTEVWSV